MRKRMIILAATFAVLAFSLLAISDESSDAAAGDGMLFDYGNGITVWTPSAGGDTIATALGNAASGAGISFVASGPSIFVDSIGPKTIGGTSCTGSLSKPGTTGVKVTTSWHIFKWVDNAWVPASLADPYASGSLAVGYYPDGTVPLETPQYRSSWAMVRGNSAQTGNQDNVSTSKERAKVEWTDTRGGTSGVYSSVVAANGKVFVKFGTSRGMSTDFVDAALRCYSETGELIWNFSFPGILFYETATPLIVGDYVYTTTGLGYIFKIPWKTGPGENNQNVTTFDGKKFDRDYVKSKTGAIINDDKVPLVGTTYATGPNSLICDSGAIYCSASNGMVYCFNLDLKLIWSYQLGGSVYFLSPTVVDGYLFTGALNGTVYVIDAVNGSLIAKEKVYTRTHYGNEYGNVAGIVCFKKAGNYTLMFPINDGRGMDSIVGGYAIYGFNGTNLTKIRVVTEGIGMMGNYFSRATYDGEDCIYAIAYDGLYRITIGGVQKCLNDKISEVHTGTMIVNNSRVHLASYGAGMPNYILDMDGKIITTIKQPNNIRNFNMSTMVTVGDRTFVGNDSGFYCILGEFQEDPPASTGLDSTAITAILIIVALSLVVVVYALYNYKMKKNRYKLNRIERGRTEGASHSRIKRKHLWIMLAVGTAIALIMFTLCLAVGSTATFSISETYSLLFSAISKGGQGLTDHEILIYYSRLPRTIIAMVVGLGLSVAGAVYQAIIRNPLVDPYIMGVSSGAGTAAVAVIAFNFTFFGLFPAHSIYLTAFAAIVGGVVAFFSTMLIAEKAGASSSNYVLAGVVVGLAFSAVQTLMLTMAGHRVTSALSWLFGSFANVSWNHVWVVLIPVLAISFSTLLWAKELNLVLIGEDQAKQMGLDVRKFNRWMLILASVLTSICVAFCGIIGFVGLVVPHLCRMVLGGDHRLVLPSAMVIGCSLMMGADFISRALFAGIELPVGAITTVIGVPVFAYLLVKRGRMYDG